MDFVVRLMNGAWCWWLRWWLVMIQLKSECWSLVVIRWASWKYSSWWTFMSQEHMTRDNDWYILLLFIKVWLELLITAVDVYISRFDKSCCCRFGVMVQKSRDKRPSRVAWKLISVQKWYNAWWWCRDFLQLMISMESVSASDISIVSSFLPSILLHFVSFSHEEVMRLWLNSERNSEWE